MLESHGTASTRHGCGAQEEIKVLGTSLGSAEFEQEATNQRLQEERRLWEASGYLICSALGKSSCNVPVLGATTLCERCLLAVVVLCGRSRRRNVKSYGTVLGGLPGIERQHQVAKMLATLPMRLGGLVLRSAQ